MMQQALCLHVLGSFAVLLLLVDPVEALRETSVAPQAVERIDHFQPDGSYRKCFALGRPLSSDMSVVVGAWRFWDPYFGFHFSESGNCASHLSSPRPPNSTSLMYVEVHGRLHWFPKPERYTDSEILLVEFRLVGELTLEIEINGRWTFELPVHKSIKLQFLALSRHLMKEEVELRLGRHAQRSHCQGVHEGSEPTSKPSSEHISEATSEPSSQSASEPSSAEHLACQKKNSPLSWWETWNIWLKDQWRLITTCWHTIVLVHPVQTRQLVVLHAAALMLCISAFNLLKCLLACCVAEGSSSEQQGSHDQGPDAYFFDLGISKVSGGVV